MQFGLQVPIRLKMPGTQTVQNLVSLPSGVMAARKGLFANPLDQGAATV